MGQSASMSNFYKTLGLRRGASEQQVKAAYRALAKQLHPDVNPGDPSAERRFKDISQAYQTLGDPAGRAAYDQFLASWRALARRRYRRLAAIAAASAVLSAGSVSAALLWIQHLHAPQAEVAQAVGEGISLEGTPRSRTEDVRPLEAVEEPLPNGGAVSVARPRVRKASNWTLYRSSRFGFALRYPADVFASDREEGSDNVHTLVSHDGRAVLRIFAADNVAGTAIADYRRALIAQRYASATFDYAPQRPSWFALSGNRGDETFYERVTFSCNGRSMHGWQITYPATERRFYDRIVERVHRNYKHSHSSRAHCGQARPMTSRPGKA